MENVKIGQNVGAIFDVYPQFADRPAASGAMTAGSCSFHNGLTVHGAGANMTNGLRRAMTCAFMPDGAVYNGQQNILSDGPARRPTRRRPPGRSRPQSARVHSAVVVVRRASPGWPPVETRDSVTTPTR